MPLLPLPDARRHVLDHCRPLTPLEVPLDAALGLVAAQPVVAAEEVPPFDNTAMDGYAVRAADTAGAPVELTVVGTLAAGAEPGPAVGPGQAVRIMTGAPIPEGADAVVMVEDTTTDADRVTIRRTAGEADHIRRAGDDVRRGQEVLAAGVVIGPGDLGVLASVGVSRLRAVPRPRVGVLSTGDELVDVDDASPLRPGQIRDSNRHTLLALVRQAGMLPVDLGLAPDRREEIAATLRRGVADCDAILTSGGVSVGDFDYVKAVLDEMSGGGMRWMQIAIRPAKPFAFGTVDGVPVFGLPGNPVSSMVSFALLALPGLRAMAGHPEPVPGTVRAVSADGLPRRPDGKLHFARVVAGFRKDGRLEVRSAGGQGSHMLRVMALSNALALVPDGEGVPAGEDVDVLVMDPSVVAAGAAPGPS